MKDKNNLEWLEKRNNTRSSCSISCSIWTIHLDVEAWVEESFIGTKYTTGIELEITLLQAASHLQHFKQTSDETAQLLHFENPLRSLTTEYFD